MTACAGAGTVPSIPASATAEPLVAAGEKPAAFPELPSPLASRLLRHMKTSSKSSTFSCCCFSRQAKARAAGGHHPEGTGQGPRGAGAGNGVARWGWRCASMGIKPASSQNLHHPQTQSWHKLAAQHFCMSGAMIAEQPSKGHPVEDILFPFLQAEPGPEPQSQAQL